MHRRLQSHCFVSSELLTVDNSIKKAIPLEADTPVFAVKLIHKNYAVTQGRISLKQISMEVSLHSHIGQHPYIIEWFATGEDDVWRWIALEYASGGDLFDKIEADVGVGENVAQLYFHQLIAGVSYCHSKGIAHRDLKPENILLSEKGDLKIADFGMATMFAYNGQRKFSSTICGSPPYVAPEVLACSRAAAAVLSSGGPSKKYDPEQVDIWSCGVILFVLLVGNTPWDEPTANSYEFMEYVEKGGHSQDEIWRNVPSGALSLLRGMMSIDLTKRFDMARIRQHPWFTEANPLMEESGRMKDPLQVATLMLERLRIDFNSELLMNGHGQINSESQPSSSMPVDAGVGFSATQPELPLQDPLSDEFEPDAPTLGGLTARAAASRHGTISSSQPNLRSISSTQPLPGANLVHRLESMGGGTQNLFGCEPSLSQFSQTPGVPLTLTQQARKFHDLVPEARFTKFLSAAPPNYLVSLLTTALHNLSVRVPAHVPEPDMRPEMTHVWMLRFRAVDTRKQQMHGEVVMDRYYLEGEYGGEVLEVKLQKVKGDPLEWRRLFKKLVVLCKEAVFVPGG